MYMWTLAREVFGKAIVSSCFGYLRGPLLESTRCVLFQRLETFLTRGMQPPSGKKFYFVSHVTKMQDANSIVFLMPIDLVASETSQDISLGSQFSASNAI
jgi:hypothetical protein